MTQLTEQTINLQLIWENNKATLLPITVTDASTPALMRRAELIGTYGVGKDPNHMRFPREIRYEGNVLYSAGQPPIDNVPVILDEDDLTRTITVQVSRDKGNTWEYFDGPFDDQADVDSAIKAALSAGYRYYRLSS